MELEQLKKLLGVSDVDVTQDAVLEFIIGDVTETILNYCNLGVLPAGLTNTAYRMAMDLYRYERPGDGSAPLMVSSISEGDISTSFASASEALNDGVLRDYRGQLNRYRKLGW